MPGFNFPAEPENKLDVNKINTHKEKKPAVGAHLKVKNASRFNKTVKNARQAANGGYFHRRL